MKDIYLILHDPQLEQKVPKLNPSQHSQAPTESFQSVLENASSFVFSDVDDSIAFAKQLRQQAWQRG